MPHTRVSREQQILQLSYATDALEAYIRAATESSSLDATSANEITTDLDTLKARVQESSFSPADGVDHLNQVILKLNEVLTKDVARYPDFSIDGPLSRVQTMNQILAFEQFLSEVLKSKDLPFTQESPLFKQAYFLWQKVSGGEIKSEQAIAKLADLVRQVNDALQEADRYPLPNLSTYTIYQK